MVGITHLAEQIRRAPPEVGQWLEHKQGVGVLGPPYAEAGRPAS